VPRGILSFAPPYEEAIAPEFYRFSGKFRFIATMIMIVTDAGAMFQTGLLGYDRDVYVELMSVNIPALCVSAGLAWALWQRASTLASMRRLTYACATIECVSTIATSWLFGSINSHMLVFGMLLVLIYRAFFDFRTGAFVFVLMLVGTWTVVALESFGVLPIAPGLAVPPAELPATARTGGMFVITVMMCVTFLVANVVVARLRNKDLAIRILRENLARVEPGNLGRHTGRTLTGTYELGRLIGTGGMGEVYEALHKRTRRHVAVKLLHAQMLEDPSLLRRFRREAEITGTLGSEHIIEIIDIDQDEGQPFIVLELLRGRSLSERIAEERQLPLSDVADLVEQTARGLQVAHDAGVVHRDLKPGNLFLAERDQGTVLKILDFGVSKIQGQATAITRELALLGTPDYMSPEQAVGVAEEVGAEADIFALGAIVYHLVTGAKPFVASSVPALLRRICDEEPIPPRSLRPDAPEDVERVIAIAMAKRPSERYASVTELAADLRAAVAGALSDAARRRAAALHRAAPSSRTHTTDTGALAMDRTAAAE
jgi:tRNA A-37 threonylcarbamoyl transferase component Bud32